jgi:hypothetical protein
VRLRQRRPAEDSIEAVGGETLETVKVSGGYNIFGADSIIGHGENL